MSDKQIRATVLGGGTWGITLAGVLAENGHEVNCWDISARLLDQLYRDRSHPKLPGYQVHASIRFESDLATALDETDARILVVPSQAMRGVCEELARRLGPNDGGVFVICAKGIEQQSGKLMHEVLADALGSAAAGRAGVLSGPSHAEEVSRCLPTTVVAAAPSAEVARMIQAWFFRPYLRVYTSDDVKGVELGGAVKNVIAIAAGISDGMGFGDNTRAALMTRGLAEIVRLGRAAGARIETFMGLSGIGDLIVTAGSRHSRNHAFGELLARGSACADALSEVGMVVEGYPSALSVVQLARSLNVEMPICEAVHSVCYEGLAPRRAVEDLLGREPKAERN